VTIAVRNNAESAASEDGVTALGERADVGTVGGGSAAASTVSEASSATSRDIVIMWGRGMMPRLFRVGCETAMPTRHVVLIALNVLCIVCGAVVPAHRSLSISRAVRIRVLSTKCNVIHGWPHTITADRSGNGRGSGVNMTLSATPPVMMPTSEPSL